MATGKDTGGSLLIAIPVVDCNKVIMGLLRDFEYVTYRVPQICKCKIGLNTLKPLSNGMLTIRKSCFACALRSCVAYPDPLPFARIDYQCRLYVLRNFEEIAERRAGLMHGDAQRRAATGNDAERRAATCKAAQQGAAARREAS